MPHTGQEPGRRTLTPEQRALRAVRRADRLAQQGDTAAAIESLQLALRLGADPFTCYLRLARLHQTCQQWADAVDAAEHAVAQDPQNVSALEAVVTLYLESRDYAGAIAASRALLKVAPRHVPARDALGAAYVGVGDVDAAMRVANDLVRLDPSNPAHHFTRAVLCQHRGSIKMAVEEFERVLQMEPDTDLARSAREQLDSLDSFQLQQIVTLAFEDAVFRIRMVHDAASSLIERGFSLSEQGMQRVNDLVRHDLADFDLSVPPQFYH